MWDHVCNTARSALKISLPEPYRHVASAADAADGSSPFFRIVYVNMQMARPDQHECVLSDSNFTGTPKEVRTYLVAVVEWCRRKYFDVSLHLIC
jgi:hypothetical protein